MIPEKRFGAPSELGNHAQQLLLSSLQLLWQGLRSSLYPN